MRCTSWRVRSGQQRPQRHPVDGELGHAPQHVGGVDVEEVEQGREQVDGVGVLVTQTARIGDAGRPGDEERVAHAALERVALPPLERRVAGQRPTPRVVPAGAEPTEVVDVGQLVVDVVGLVTDVVAQLVPRAVRSALGRAPVVGDHDDHRVVGVGAALDLVEHPADVMVGVGQESGEDLHHPGVEPLSVRVDVDPRLDPVGARREHGLGRHDAQLLLAGERLLAPHVPPGVETPGESVDPLGRRLVRRMRRTGGVPEQVGAVRVVEAQITEAGDGLVGQVGVEVVALLGGRRRLDMVLVAHQVRGPLVGLAVEEAVVALEPETGRPGVERAVGPLVAGGEVPLADGRRRVAPIEQNLGECAGRSGDLPRVAGVVDGHVGQHPHADAMVVAAREQRGARR